MDPVRGLAPEHRLQFEQVTGEFTTAFGALQTKVRNAVADIVAHRRDPHDRAQRRKVAYRIRHAVSPELVPAVRRALEGKRMTTCSGACCSPTQRRPGLALWNGWMQMNPFRPLVLNVRFRGVTQKPSDCVQYGVGRG